MHHMQRGAGTGRKGLCSTQRHPQRVVLDASRTSRYRKRTVPLSHVGETNSPMSSA